MATIINLPVQKKNKRAIHKKIATMYDIPGRNPEKAIIGMYGLWKGLDISIEKIRAKKRCKKW